MRRVLAGLFVVALIGTPLLLAGEKEAATKGKDGCCLSKAKTVAAKGECCQKEKTVAAKGECATSAKLTAACAGKEVAACGGKAGCGSGKAVAMPTLLYRIGTFQTGCEETAKTVAASSNEPLTYLVDSKSYEERGEAVAALTALLEKQASEMLTVRFVVGDSAVSCPNEAATLAAAKKTGIKYRVAGREFTCKEKAGLVAKRAQEAVTKLAMSYKVGKDSFCCSATANSVAKNKGTKLQFVVGEKATQCPVEAKLLMAQTKVRAILASGQEGENVEVAEQNTRS